jgi:hypothetical protein
VALSAVDGMHWSSTIMMSLPMATCVPMLVSGLSRCDGAVHVAAELGAFFLHVARVGQREDLEAARVGEEGLLPAGEFMDAAEALEDLGTRTQEQVIGVRQQDLPGLTSSEGVEVLGP